MHALLFVACLAAVAAAQFAPSPVDFLAADVDPASLANWQLCASVSTAVSVDYAVVLAKCGGTRLLLACAAGTPLLPVAAATNATTWAAGGNVTSTLPPNALFSVNTTATALYAGTADPALCTAATGGLCFPLANGTLAVGAYCGPALGFVVSSSVSRVFYTNPCEGRAVNASCPSVLGQCGVNPRCSVNGTCDAASKRPVPDSCIDTALCDPVSGNVTATYLPAGATCSLNNNCVVSSVCAANHTCVPTVYFTCPQFIAPCLQNGVCNLTTQFCEYAQQPVGTICSLETACHYAGTCDAGAACIEAPAPPPALTCGVAANCSDLTGWTYTPAPLGTLCTSSNQCIANATCNGAGTGGAACTGAGITCPLQTCRGPAYCNNATGACVSARLPSGTPCDDGTPCTQGTTCGMIGTCGGGYPALACPSNPPTCYQYTLQALNASTCACVLVPRANGTGCDDGDICTTDDVCAAGVCAGAPTTCPGDDCNFPLGVCSPTTGCLNPRANYLPCNSTCMIDGQCQTGVCLGGTFNAANPACVPGAGRRVSAALDAWLDDDAWAAAWAAVRQLADALPMIGLGGGVGPDKHGWVPAE